MNERLTRRRMPSRIGDPRPASRGRAPWSVPAALAGCIFLSGAAGLVYEVVWLRLLGLVFGHTVFAVTSVLAAFMAGLALGAALFGRVIDAQGRALRFYAFLEAGIGLFGLLTPLLLSLAQKGYLALYAVWNLSPLAFSLVQFSLVFVILLVPTTLMGATLPVLSTCVVERLEGVGQTVGRLYGLNTLGAVAGAAAAGFFLLPAIGVRWTIVLTAAVNLGVAAAALALDRGIGQPAPRPADRTRAGRQPRSKDEVAVPAGPLLPLIVYGIGLSGAAAMIYEVAWTRALSLVIGSSVYAFSAMLTTFLAGLAVGSLLFARIWGQRRIDPALFGWLEAAVGLAALSIVPLFDRLPGLVLAVLRRAAPSPGTALVTQFALSFLVMIVPTTLLGATFPCAVQLCARALPRLGRDVGEVYSANTVGTIAGAALAGFLLIPALGAQVSMTVAAAVNAGVGVAVLLASGGHRSRWGGAGLIGVGVLLVAGMTFLPRWDSRVMVGGASIYLRQLLAADDPAARFRELAAARQLVYYREGINATVAVERVDGLTALRVDGKVDATNGADMATQLMLGHLPVVLHPRPERVLVVGLGSGVTAGAMAQHADVRAIDVVELEPAVVEASRFFAAENRGVLRDPRVRVLIGDARNVILAGSARYDVVSSEPSNPWIAGMANLFSAEFYRLVRDRLADGGVMVQWVHGYALFPRELKMIVNTFLAVFPHATLWHVRGGDYLLVGAVSPVTLDYAVLERRMAASAQAREDLAAIGVSSPADLLTFFVLDEADLAAFAKGAPLNTDDRPLLEFAAPTALYADTAGENHRLVRQARSGRSLPIVNLPPGLLEARRVHAARAYWTRGEREEALELLRDAGRLSPRDRIGRLERVKLLLALGELRSANEELARLAQRFPQDRLLKSYLRAGAILEEQRLGQALADQARIDPGDPNPAASHNTLGVMFMQLGTRFREPAFFDLAIAVLQGALQIVPASSTALNNLGSAYLESGRLEEAERAFRRVIDMAPRLAEARFNLGLVYARRRQLDLAAREFEAALALRPGWSAARTHLRTVRDRAAASVETGRRPDAPPSGGGKADRGRTR